MITLLDVNVLVALAWPNHLHHRAAHRWFGRHRAAGWATCSITETGFVRVSSNPRVIPEARTPGQALLLLRAITAVAGHEFWIDDVSPATDEAFPSERLVGYQQVTDAHLLALTIRRGGRLATFDSAVLDLAGDRARERVVVLASQGIPK